MNYLINDINDFFDNIKLYLGKKIFFAKDKTADIVMIAGILNIALFFALLKPWGNLLTVGVNAIFTAILFFLFCWIIIPLIDFTAFKLFGKTSISNILSLSKYIFTPFLILVTGSYLFNSPGLKMLFFIFLCLMAFAVFTKILGICYRKEGIEIFFFLISFFAFYSIMLVLSLFFFSLALVS
ncbi:MAG: hypothetical protein WC337_00385 [Candidatus Muiribacteriota bacterium]